MKLKTWILLISALLFAGLSATPVWTQSITVTGSNNPAIDIPAIQSAVDYYTEIDLQGTFNFGTITTPSPYAGVVITKPGRTIRGIGKITDPDGNILPAAKIIGGYWPFYALPMGGTVPSDLTIRNLRFEGPKGNPYGWSIIIYGAGWPEGLTVIEDNAFIDVPRGIAILSTDGSIEIRNNILRNIYFDFGIYVVNLPLPTDQHLNISGNAVEMTRTDGMTYGIRAGVWPIQAGAREHGQVIINNNAVGFENPYLAFLEASAAIDVGGTIYGVSNALVEGNIITGFGQGGINHFNGYGCRIEENDFSGFTAYSQDVCTGCSKDVITRNTFGPHVIIDLVYAWPMAVRIWDVDFGMAFFGLPPGPPVSDIVISDNDYRLTNLPGFSLDSSGTYLQFGCVGLYSVIDMGGPGTGVTNNLINETGRFPVGTGGPQNQVLEIPSHAYGNRIVGHAANQYAQLSADNPGIGQKIKDALKAHLEMMLKTAKEEIELVGQIND